MAVEGRDAAVEVGTACLLKGEGKAWKPAEGAEGVEVMKGRVVGGNTQGRLW